MSLLSDFRTLYKVDGDFLGIKINIFMLFVGNSC